MKPFNIYILVFLSISSLSVYAKTGLTLELKDRTLFFTAVNWSYDKSLEKVNMCIDEPDGIEIGILKDNKFIKSDIIAQFNLDCVINEPTHLEAFQILGVIYDIEFIKDVYLLPEKEFNLVFRICSDQQCLYSNPIVLDNLRD